MNDKFKILILTNELLTTCGVSKHLLYFLKDMKNQTEFEFSIFCGGGDAVNSYRDLCKEIFISEKIKHENRSFINYLASLSKILRIAKKNKYHILHSHNHYAANIAQVVSRFSKVKTVQSIHGIIDPIGRLNHYPADYFIAVNEHVKDNLVISKNKSVTQVKLIRYGIIFNEQMSLPQNKKLKIIAAGRLINIKAFDIYIKAIAQLSDEVKAKSEFYLAGKGECESELFALAKQLNIKISFLGQIKDLINYFETTDILVNPSRSSNEGFPITIIEAALTKNLIISSNFLGHDSILKDKINALIFNVNEPNDLANKLEFAIENYKDLNNLIKGSYNQAYKEFNVDKMITKTISFYEETLK